MTAPTFRDAYLRTLADGLRVLPMEQRDEIVREIASHVDDLADSVGIESAIARMGSAELLARQYLADVRVEEAARGFSPRRIFSATLALARVGVAGGLLLLVTLLGYSIGAGLMIVALMRPILGPDVGLWIGPYTFFFGVPGSSGTEAHEVLGDWTVPFGLTVGPLILILTTWGVRRIMLGLRRQA